MKTLTVLSLIVLNLVSNSKAEACSCGYGSWPIDPTDAIIGAAIPASGGGRSTKIDKQNDIKLVKVHPTLLEKLNIDGFKGTSCEVHGPNGESLHYCMWKRTEDFKVTVHRHNGTCDLIIRAKTTTRSAKARVIENNCKPKSTPIARDEQEGEE